MGSVFKPRSLTAYALVMVSISVGIGVCAGTAATDAGMACVWAGSAHPQQATVIAGGWSFECGRDGVASRWHRGPRVNEASTVPNPGASSGPAGLFSTGAQQPGTAYTDYCVGSQLIEGAEDIYEVVRDRTGATFWKAAGPISQWSFDVGSEPQRSWRSSSLCYDGQLT